MEKILTFKYCILFVPINEQRERTISSENRDALNAVSGLSAPQVRPVRSEGTPYEQSALFVPISEQRERPISETPHLFQRSAP